MKDRLFNFALSFAAAFGLLKAGGVPQGNAVAPRELEVDRLIVRKELIVSDTGKPWEAGYEAQEIPRGIYARSIGEGTAGLWVRSRLIKGELDDPFDDRFHALERNGSLRTAPGHISWNAWLGGAWRQVAIIQGEGVEYSEMPEAEWSGGNHPGRIRFQTFRPHHGEPLTDMLIGQGKVSIGGGGYGGGGLPDPRNILELWGGKIAMHPLEPPAAPRVTGDDGSGPHEYALLAISPEGVRTAPSPAARSRGLARLEWDSATGADAYVVLRDGKDISGVLRIEGARKVWQDPGKP